MTDKVLCSKSIWSNYHRLSCGGKPAVTRDGKPYCKRHDPSPEYGRTDTWYSWEKYAEVSNLLTHVVTSYTSKTISILAGGRAKAQRESIEGYYPTRDAAIEARRDLLFQRTKSAKEVLDAATKAWAHFTLTYPKGGTNGKAE